MRRRDTDTDTDTGTDTVPAIEDAPSWQGWDGDDHEDTLAAMAGDALARAEWLADSHPYHWQT